MTEDLKTPPNDQNAQDDRSSPNNQPAVQSPAAEQRGDNYCRYLAPTGPRKPDRDWYDIANLSVLVFAFLAAAAAAYEAYRLARLTQDAISHADTSSDTQHVDMQRTLEQSATASTIQHADTQQALAQTAAATAISREAFDASQVEARVRLRSYLSMAATRSTLIAGQPLTATVIVQAGGQTPALNVKGNGHVGPKPTELKRGDIIIDAPGEKANAISLNPGNTISLVGRTPVPVNQFTYDSLKKGTQYRFYMWGRVTYEDVFGCHRWQNYCFRVNDSNGSNPPDIDPCTKYNDAEGPPGECPVK
jgi:hypothetical protein